MGKRVLLISSNSSGRGGGERYLVYLTQGLRLLGCEVHVLLSTLSYMNGWATELAAEGAYVHRKNLLGLRSRPLRFLQSILDKKQQLEIAKNCQEIAPDAILVNQQYDEDGLDYLAGALMANVAPVGGTLHMPMTANKHRRPLGKFRGQILKSWYRKNPYSLILVSQGSKQEFENYYTNSTTAKIVNHGCKFSVIKEVSPSLPNNWINELPVLGFSGQFVFQKNLKLLIDSWLWTRKQGIDSKLLLVGDGLQRDELEKHLHDTVPSDRWYITGWQTHPETYLSVMDIYTMTSHFEGLPLALLEATGRGIPAVVTNFNGASDVADRASWVKVVKEPKPESVGKVLIESIQNLPLLKQQAIQNQKQFQEYFSLERMAKETLAALDIA